MPTATVNGIHLYYELTGQGPAVTFLHGFTLDGRMWADQVPVFAQQYRVLVPDLRGFGRSQALDTPHPQAADVAQLLRTLGIARTHVVGLSMGGGVAVDWLLAHPEQVTSLVLVDSSMPGFRRLDNTAARCEELAKSVGVDAAITRWLADPLFEGSRRRPAVFQRLSEMISGYHGGRWLGTMPPRRGCANVVDRLQDIHVPTLVIVGELDVPEFHEIADAYVAGIAGAQKVVIPTAGHMSNMDEPERFNEVVLQFLARAHVGA
jgi:3-oxoadipate enol-lactonase